MDKAHYLHDPCGASSLPFWKTNSIFIPDDLLILREDDPRLQEDHAGYIDTPYSVSYTHLTLPTKRIV